MTLKKKFQIGAIVLLFLAIPLSIPNTNWNSSYSVLSFIALVLGTVGSVTSIFIPVRYELGFKNSDWVLQGNFYTLTIPYKKHGVSMSPNIEFYTSDDGVAFSKALTSPNIDKDGNVTITVNRPYIGKGILT